ncbi:MAG: ABC transporter ATP-binding protein [Phycisphaerae bacterium]|nr:ABC transporter ATP-binding protein [Phycisphaerae bacterium]
MHAVRTDALTKHYGRVRALQDLHLLVPAGSLFGFLGPNGAGKTTTLRLLLGLLRPTRGRAAVLGLDSRRDSIRIRRRTGYLPGDLRLYDHLTARETLDFFTAARGADARDEVARLAGAFDLPLDRRVRDCSKGMKQKLGLLIALAHRPELLILDEPASALDPLVQQTLYDELRAAVRRGATVLFSSHVLGEVEALCDHVAIVRAGRLIEQQTIDALRSRAPRRVELRIRPGANLPPAPSALSWHRRDDRSAAGAWTGSLQPLFEWLARCDVEDAQIGKPDLEDLFLAYYDEPAAALPRAAASASGDRP